MNERNLNGYFSRETAERLPGESERRRQLVAERAELSKKRERLQREFDAFISDMDGVPNDEQIKQGISMMDEMEKLGSNICWLSNSIDRLDAGETLADIYKQIFG